MRTILHIGQHKTGTTSVQHYLASHRDALARDGLYVPNSLAGSDSPSHFLLNVYALDKNRFSSKKEALARDKPESFFANLKGSLEFDIAEHYSRAQRQGCRDVIWSNEGLYLLNSVAEYERLRELFQRHSSKVACICCFRDKEAYRASRIAQLKRQGIALSDDKDSYRYFGPDSWLLDYAGKERLLRKVFDEVTVFPYDAVDMVGTFMRQVGYSAAPGAAHLRMNVTGRDG